MGVAASCNAGGCGSGRCNKDAENRPASQVNNSRQNYDLPGKDPGSPSDQHAAFVEEPIDENLWKAKEAQLLEVERSQSREASAEEAGVVGIEKSPLEEHAKPTDGDTKEEGGLTAALVEVRIPPEGTQDDDSSPEGQDDSQDPRYRRMSWKAAARKAMLAKNMGAKIAIENKIGTKLEGWFRDIALELQRGVAAQGRNEEYRNFKAPEGQLFDRCRIACGFTSVRYFATMGLQDGLTEPNLALIGDKDAAGKSGSFFFLSPDQQLIAKSCTKEDWKTLLRILPSYVEFVEAARAKANARVAESDKSDVFRIKTNFVRGFTETLLPRFLGLYKLRLPDEDPKAEPTRVLVMANVFGGAMSIDRRYDLKGSTVGRKASAKECAKRAPTYKDIDWVATEPGLCLISKDRQMLLEAIRMDLDFLAKHGLMDYSLLVGVHDIAKEAPSGYEVMNVVTLRDQTRHCYLGIIDVLTPYGMKKRAETLCMGHIVFGRDISCQHPKVYAQRFLQYVDKQVFQLCDAP